MKGREGLETQIPKQRSDSTFKRLTNSPIHHPLKPQLHFSQHAERQHIFVVEIGQAPNGVDAEELENVLDTHARLGIRLVQNVERGGKEQVVAGAVREVADQNLARCHLAPFQPSH